MRVCVCLYVCVCMCVCVYACVCVIICAYVFVHAYLCHICDVLNIFIDNELQNHYSHLNITFTCLPFFDNTVAPDV